MTLAPASSDNQIVQAPAPTRLPWSARKDQILEWVWPVAAFLIALAAALALRNLIFRWVRRRFRDSNLAALWVETLDTPSVLWCLVAAIDIAVNVSPRLTPRQVVAANYGIGVFAIVSITLVAASLAVRLVSAYGERQGMPFAVAGLSRTLIRILVLAIGLMTLLHLFGVNIVPLVATFGVTGLAVALALQDTLANFFAGMHILIERPIFVGDIIRLDNAHEGVVTDIGWRTTRVRTGNNEIIVIPNTKITSGILVNSSLPTPRTQGEIVLMVAHEADSDQVKRIALEEAAAADGVLKDPAPAFLCEPGVLATHTQYKLLVTVESRPRQGAIHSDIRMAIMRRFREEGVPLPVVIRPQAGSASDPLVGLFKKE